MVLFAKRRHVTAGNAVAVPRCCCATVLICLSLVWQPAFAQQTVRPDRDDEPVGSDVTANGNPAGSDVAPVNEQVQIDVTPREDQARIYRTPQERREAGLKRKLTDWLTLSGLVEFEYIFQRFGLSERPHDSHEHDLAALLQLSLEVSPVTWMTAEVVYEYSRDSLSDWTSDRGSLDEATVSFEAGDFELVAGKQYVPFGVYFSNFVSSPLVEFGETRDPGMTLSYIPGDRLDFSAFAYDGQAKKAGSKGRSWGWGLAAEAAPSEYISFGASYLSDLADSQEDLLDDFDDRYERRVDAWSGFTAIEYDRFVLTGELVRAIDSFEELDADRNKPRAWNVELAFYPEGNFEFALRLEGSDELEDAPRLQGGAAVSWRVTEDASVTVEYLHGNYESGLAEDSHERELDKVDQFGALVSIEF